MDHKGNTTIHLAAIHGHIAQIPRKFINEETLTRKNNSGKSPLELLVDGRTSDNSLEPILGTPLSPAVIPVVGASWFNQNAAILAQINDTPTLITSDAAVDIEI